MTRTLGWALVVATLTLACAGPSGSGTDPEEHRKEREERAEREKQRRHEPIELPRRTPGSY